MAVGELHLDVDGEGSVSFSLSRADRAGAGASFSWVIEFVDLAAWDAFCARCDRDGLVTRNMRIVIDGGIS